MQFFPTDTSLYSNTFSPEELAKRAEEDTRKKGDTSFSDVYSSFIEPGRTDYTGVPKGFSALDTPGSVLGRTKTDALRGLLQEGNAPQSSMNILDDLVDSGKSITVGRIFGALSGTSRASAGLDDLERADCEKLLKKLGFSTDESQELIQMGEEGKGTAAWKRISQKIEDMDESTLSVNPAEIAALLRSLDVTKATRETINRAAQENQLDAMNKGELKTLLAQVDKELGEKELAQQTMLRSLRPAIDEALKTAKLDELGGPSADMRAGSRNIASELRMRSAAFEQAEGEGLQSDAKSHEEHMEVSKDLHQHQEDLRKDGQEEATKGKQQFAANTEQAQKEAPKAAPAPDPVRDMLNSFDVQLDRPMAQEAKAPAQPVPTAHLKQEVFAQVEQGILQSNQNGGQQLTMQLSTGELGKVSLVLSMQEGELKTLLAQVDKELGEKELAQQTMLRSLRPAIDEALKTAKLDELGGPSADMRAGSRNIASELRMRSAAFEQAEGEGLQSDAKSHEEHMEVSKDLHQHQEDLRKDGQEEATKGKQQFAANTEQAQKEAPKAAPAPDPVRDMLNSFDVQLDRPMAQEAKAPAQPVPTAHLKQEVFAQVEQGILQSNQNGGQQLTMQLSTGELGKVSLVLSMQEGELKAVFKAENKESAAALTEQIAELKAQLEENGIKVAEIDVQTNVREDSSSHTWQQGQHDHNFMQDSLEQQRFARPSQLRREAGESVHTNTATNVPAGREQGLHIVA